MRFQRFFRFGPSTPGSFGSEVIDRRFDARRDVAEFFLGQIEFEQGPLAGKRPLVMCRTGGGTVDLLRSKSDGYEREDVRLGLRQNFIRIKHVVMVQNG